MASVKEKVHAEMENITKVLNELEKVKNRPNKEVVVLVGIGAYLQNNRFRGLCLIEVWWRTLFSRILALQKLLSYQKQ